MATGKEKLSTLEQFYPVALYVTTHHGAEIDLEPPRFL